MNLLDDGLVDVVLDSGEGDACPGGGRDRGVGTHCRRTARRPRSSSAAGQRAGTDAAPCWAPAPFLSPAAAGGTNTVEREGISIVHPAKFIMIGSGNPAEGELRPQLLDRFGLSGEGRGQGRGKLGHGGHSSGRGGGSPRRGAGANLEHEHD